MLNETEEKILRLKSAIEKTGLLRSTLYQMISDGLFPKPVTIGIRSVGWPQSEINTWVQERIARSNYKEST